MDHKQKIKKLKRILVIFVIISLLLLFSLYSVYKKTPNIRFKYSLLTVAVFIFAILLIIILFRLDYRLINKTKEDEKLKKINTAKELEEQGFEELTATRDPIKSVDELLYLNAKKDLILISDDEDDKSKGFEEYKKISEQIEKLSLEENEEQEEKSRFYMLTEIDEYYKHYKKPEYNDNVTLVELCKEFRNFSAGSLHLYYSIEDIRRFISSLAVTKLIILQGMSGTGKTSLAYAFGEFLNRKTTVVPIQPMWKERTDLVGYYNEFTKKFNETTLLYTMYDANYNDDVYITVLDEMNIARIEYYFAEFLSLLELPNPEGRNLDIVSDKWENDPKLLINGKLRLPNNMWFIGTANNDDSTFAISDKVYDRAMVLNLDSKAEVFDAPNPQKCRISSDYLEFLFTRAKEEYALSDRNLRRIKELDKYMIDTFHLTFGNRIMKQIFDYVPVLVACGGTEIEALDDILSRKVFRKLESKNPVYVREMSDSLCSYLDELFGNDKLPLCKEAIALIEQNV